MKLVYLTAKQYPGGTADHHYIYHLAKAFYEELGQDFKFVAINTVQADLADLPLVNVRIPRFLKRTLVFFFWIPFFWRKRIKSWRKNGNTSDNGKIVFFSNDLNLLAILIFWKKILHFPVKIIADWHLAGGTWKDKFVLSNVDGSVTTSAKLKITLMAIYARRRNKNSRVQKIWTVYGGVGMEIFDRSRSKSELRKELGLPQDKFLVGYVGLFKTMGQEKGVLIMIDSLEHLEPGICMVFVGGKKEEISDYRDYASRKKVEERCVFFPIQPYGKVAEFERAMDVLVIPYPNRPHFREYGFPMKVYEYMASGVPIVYSKLELVEEVVGDCAYGFEPDNSIDLAKVINRLKSNIGEAEETAIKARDRVKRLTWKEKAKSICYNIAHDKDTE